MSKIDGFDFLIRESDRWQGLRPTIERIQKLGGLENAERETQHRIAELKRQETNLITTTGKKRAELSETQTAIGAAEKTLAELNQGITSTREKAERATREDRHRLMENANREAAQIVTTAQNAARAAKSAADQDVTAKKQEMDRLQASVDRLGRELTQKQAGLDQVRRDSQQALAGLAR